MPEAGVVETRDRIRGRPSGLPLLFAAGMSLLDCLDGLFMSVAYDWAFLNPVRKVYYNISITGLSVAVAFGSAPSSWSVSCTTMRDGSTRSRPGSAAST